VSGLSAGFKRPGVQCVHCLEPIALLLAVEDFVSVEKLPDPFPAKCPLCEQEATYSKSTIGIVASVGSR
jgi:hypothetical protein